ncbi:MAG: hypothetical protein ABEK12_02115 [Candidatus Nanohaloarchaea archaeon]
MAVAGIDQRKIHMLAREKLPKLGYDKPTCLHWPMLPSLTGSGEKMSSSKKETMFPLHADPEHIREVVEDAFCPAGQIKDNPVLALAKFFVFGADEDLAVERDEEYGGDVTFASYGAVEDAFASEDLHPVDLKDAVATTLVDRLEPVRDRFREEPELLEPLREIGHDDPDYLS